MSEVKHLKEIMDLKFQLADLKIDNADKALKIQATIYESRLTTLNHAHDAAVEAQAKTVPRELFDANNKEVSKEMSELKAFKDNFAGRQYIFGIIFPVIISLIFLGINYLINK